MTDSSDNSIPKGAQLKRTYSNNWKMTFEAQLFPQYRIPHGYLNNEVGCHGLFRYYLAARQTYETIILDPIVYEGTKDPVFNFVQLFKSIAQVYGVEPEHMVKFWLNVDMQCGVLKIPKMPHGDRFRFDHTPNIKTGSKKFKDDAKQVKAGKSIANLTVDKRMN